MPRDAFAWMAHRALQRCLCVSAWVVCTQPSLLARAVGGDLAVVTAPRGVDLREAISQALSQSHLHLGRRTSGQARSSVPSTPHSFPSAPASAVGTPQGPAGLGAAAHSSQFEAQHDEAASGSASWHWLLRGRFSGLPDASSGSGSRPAVAEAAQLPGPLQPAPPSGRASRSSEAVAGAAPAAAAAPTASSDAAEHEQRPRATTADQLELLPTRAPPVRLEGGRPWSHDGTAASLLGVPRSLRPSPLELAYRARAAGGCSSRM